MVRPFWKRNPALAVGLHLLLGSALAVSWHWVILLPLGIFFLFSPCRYGGVALTLLFFIYAKICSPTFPHLEDPMTIKGRFSISTLKVDSSPFQRSFCYQGRLKEFEGDNGECGKNLPCKIYLPLNSERPSADRDYLVKGRLIQKSERNYHLKPVKGSPWEGIDNSFSFAEQRYRAKEGVRSYFKHHFKKSRAASFLIALATGELDERALSFEFGKLGLQHILAISGFHFALLAMFIGVFLRMLLSPKQVAATILVLLTLYAFFIGKSPSLERAWIAIAIFQIGELCNLRTTALNALGMGLVVELLLDPLSLMHLGFQLSFLATIAILLLYPSCNRLLSYLLPKRSLSQVASMLPLHQHGYLFSALLRKAIALNISVLLFTLPLLLHAFHKFPLLSLIYNLFFPFWVSLSILLALLAIPLTFLLPPMGSLLHQINNFYTSHLLELTAHPPALLDYTLRVQTFPFPLLIALLTLLFSTAIILHEKLKF
jgi:competence protein ComEC